MRQTVSYGAYIKVCEENEKVINHGRRFFDATLDIFRTAVDFFVSVCDAKWSVISSASTESKKRNALEKLTLTSKKHPVVQYDFRAQGDLFRCMPCYLRRTAAACAIEIYASYSTRHEQWLKTQKGKEPQLPGHTESFPMMYRGNMFRGPGSECGGEVKVFDGHSWICFPISLRKTDTDYISRHCAECTESALRLPCKARQAMEACFYLRKKR